MNRLKDEFPVQLSVISVDVQTALGQDLIREYGKFTPTFVFFNPEGEEVWRSVGTIDPAQVRESLK